MLTTPKIRGRRHGRRGQATAELVAGIVGLAAIFTGVLQVAQLGDAAVANMLDARTEAIISADNLLGQEAQSMMDWEDGADGLSVTSDDVVVNGNATQINPMANELYEPISMDPLIDRDWMLSELALGTGSAANLHRGETDREVPLEPALKKLLFLINDTIEISDEAYMPQLTIDFIDGAP